ncbi:hypothetical protein [Collinsella intestinalis]|uniref:hypothetical protein n=1 Tax=Collinsella intestinalis TaxID=147207 RepID=UPI0022E926AA|nr:hypothetical protein [Collinsella intestinalis]
MEVLAVIEDGLNSPIAGVLIGGAITLIAQRMAARASLREQKSMLFAREKVQHYYRINDLLFELDEALSSYASAPVRPGENLSDDEMRERDMQGVEALEKIINLASAISNEGMKARVVGSRRVALQLDKVTETLNTLMTKQAENAIYQNGLFVQSLHDGYVAKIVEMSEEMVRLMHEELES